MDIFLNGVVFGLTGQKRTLFLKTDAEKMGK
jgi:hypothetical protein